MASIDPAHRPPPQPLPLAQPHVVTETRNVTVDVFRALGDPVRLALLAQIAAHGPVCVCRLEEALSYRQSRVSKHLAILRRAGLVSSRRDGSWAYYTANAEALDIARTFLDQLEESLAHVRVADACDEPV
jgi:ArsR family transcriptional regulator, arsenate/arsenite/antimonite-responsive transcriptional repressor